MSVTLQDDLRHGSVRVLRIENEVVRADFMPELGAKVWSLIHRPTGQEILWHHPGLTPQAVAYGANYDDHFVGGWDELFPNDAPGSFQGADLPDHGEYWCQAWDWEPVTVTPDEVTIRFSLVGRATHTHTEKLVTLRAGESTLHFAHTIRNVGDRALDVLWKLHPALRLGPASRLDVPATEAVVVHPEWSRVAPAVMAFPWPTATLPDGRVVDFTQVPPPGSGSRDFLYLLGLSEGWCALTDTTTGVGLALAFPRDVFTSVWVFLTNGGWRGLDCLVLEPCTAWPKDLDEAVARGQIAHVAPGLALTASVAATVYCAPRGVMRVSPAGAVTPR